MAVDLRKPTGTCLVWLRQTLLVEERQGTIEATEERRPAHFHIAVLDREVVPPTRAADEAPATSERTERQSLGEVVASFARYRVRPGDTLWEIARRNDTTINRIRALNKLRTARIVPGQTLLLPVS
jgi:nucleoid-associated protein YgaU